MKALAMLRDKPGVHIIDRPKPEIKQPDEVLVKVKQAGVDGTDFNMFRFNLQDPADGRDGIVMGHEMVGIVEEVGADVKELAPGDAVVTTVRRGCGICLPCLNNQSDMCLTGLYTERGIHKADGYFTEYIVDLEQYMVKVPAEYTKDMAVLTEPLSIVEKGIEQIKIIQSRMPWSCDHPEHDFSSPDWGGCKTAMVIGAGPLGILATSLLGLAEVRTTLVDIVPETSPKAKLADHLGALYVDASSRSTAEIVEYCCGLDGRFDIVFEASGASATAMEMLNYISRGSIVVMTGIPRAEMVAEIDMSMMLRQIVRNNQVIVGSINSNRNHFEMSIRNIAAIKAKYGNIFEKLITHRYKLDDAEAILTLNDPEHIKTIIDIDEW